MDYFILVSEIKITNGVGEIKLSDKRLRQYKCLLLLIEESIPIVKMQKHTNFKLGAYLSSTKIGYVGSRLVVGEYEGCSGEGDSDCGCGCSGVLK